MWGLDVWLCIVCIVYGWFAVAAVYFFLPLQYFIDLYFNYTYYTYYTLHNREERKQREKTPRMVRK